MLAPQIEKFYYELANPLVASALCLVHQRFSTNTFPSWKLAHPYRYMAHNGEINTIRGNVSWMNARQSVMQSPLYDGQIDKLYPVIVPGGSDSASIDNAVEFLYQSGRSLPHVMAMLIPEAWAGNPEMDPEKRAFYEYHASLMEPWDGPASVCFTDGRVVGATLDRNGLRPGRYIVTKDDLVVLASEVGVIEVPPEDVRKKGRLQPGRMFLVDTVEHRIISDEEIKKSLAGRQPYGEWLKEQQVLLDDLPEPWRVIESDPETLLRRQRACGYSEEDLKILLGPMGSKGEEPIGSMGADTPLACLSDRPQQLFSYFKQLFAQVTNPPIDPIREELVMSLISYIGTERNILNEAPENCHTLKLPHPILTNRDLEKLRRISSGDLLATTLPTLFRAEDGEAGLKHALDDLSARAAYAVASGYYAADPVGPRRERDDGADSQPAGDGRGAQPAGARQDAHAGGVDYRERRAARGDALCAVDWIWGERDQPVPGVRDAARHEAARAAGGRRDGRVRGEELHQGDQQGTAEDLLQDGDQHAAELSRGAGVRGGGAEQGAGGRLLLRHGLAGGGRGAGCAGARGADEARIRLPAADRVGDGPGGGRAVPVPRGRRVPPGESGDHQQAAAGGAAEQSGDVPGVHRPDRRAEQAPVHAARADAVQVRGRAAADRGGGAGQGDCEALHHRRDELSAPSARRRTRRWRLR